MLEGDIDDDPDYDDAREEDDTAGNLVSQLQARAQPLEAWIGWLGGIAHPASPNGGGGPGGFGSALPTGESTFATGILHPWAPSVRLIPGPVIAMAPRCGHVRKSPPRTVTGSTKPNITSPSMVIFDMTIEVLADVFDPSVTGASARTFFTWGSGWSVVGARTTHRKGIVESIDSVPQATGTVTVQTKYKRKGFEKRRSAYGRGTTLQDKCDGNVTLGFHESCHRDDVTRYFESGLFPQFNGVPGMSVVEFERLWKRFELDFYQIPVLLDEYSTRMTDEVGVTLTEYKRRGKRRQRGRK